jgi:hypothetical protein
MNSKYSRALIAMEQCVQIMDELAVAIERGQNALVRMDLPAFEQLTAEQERLCARIKNLQSGHLPSQSDAETPTLHRAEPGRSEFDRQRAILEQHCLAVQKRVRHLNHVNHFFLNRARQSFELLLRLAELSQGTYSLQTAGVLSECAEKGE